ncbi:amidohydrolase family protein [Litorilinea aerophila]|uniref:Amidohydrolase n=1 Tax=Litorilinea aerophila TaxID=1204385 RepID=A0A540VMX0_9CHLR|nr:amidohydrolase family protein [Litorilinea aerophila]MCC9075163.1 amidohydrolase family protein [Litorilinea aerophila]GIV78164.1 MAG: amidohydrolase [Litorilinea sp.]GIV78167.1 MAG: amidohydrolase [Litorilinea sp.]
MSTPLLIVDTDIHPGLNGDRVAEFLPEPWRTRFRSGNRSSGTLGYWNPNGVNRVDAVLEDGTRIEQDPQALARHLLDEYHISYGILNVGSVLHLGVSPEPDYAAALISAMNDVVIHDWLPADPRYRASIAVYPNDPELAVREIHRLGDHPGVVQVIMPSAARMPYGQRFFHPIYAAAVEHNLPVAIHPGTEGVGISGAPTVAGYPTSYFEWHTNLVSSYIAHLVSMVVEGVFVKFPSLKFVMLEGGVSWLPPILWRFDKNWKALRMTTPWLERPPSEYVQEHVLLSTQPLEEPEDRRHFTAILEMFDAGNMLMFSTDYPHWDGDTPDFAARAFPPELRSRVMGETACRLYGLPMAVAA